MWVYVNRDVYIVHMCMHLVECRVTMGCVKKCLIDVSVPEWMLFIKVYRKCVRGYACGCKLLQVYIPKKTYLLVVDMNSLSHFNIHNVPVI